MIGDGNETVRSGYGYLDSVPAGKTPTYICPIYLFILAGWVRITPLWGTGTHGGDEVASCVEMELSTSRSRALLQSRRTRGVDCWSSGCVVVELDCKC
ncbi:hypothetical protein TorRG33x02_027760 [Trema orientale]|uniref:Uncharacterized protein n=1 Tax=Trema orientale TaxID=63057 RepID=A0A2P5FUK6_TREOI|nr:hypothetical protein TorRG33x02_027760 [Trema orientale]